MLELRVNTPTSAPITNRRNATGSWLRLRNMTELGEAYTVQHTAKSDEARWAVGLSDGSIEYDHILAHARVVLVPPRLLRAVCFGFPLPLRLDLRPQGREAFKNGAVGVWPGWTLPALTLPPYPRTGPSGMKDWFAAPRFSLCPDKFCPTPSVTLLPFIFHPWTSPPPFPSSWSSPA